jgi:hypothetical protein
MRAHVAHPVAAPLIRLLRVTFGPQTVIGEEFDLVGADSVLIYGSWAERYRGTPGLLPNDVDVLVVRQPAATPPTASRRDEASRLGNGTTLGLAIARGRGAVSGRPTVASADRLAAAREPILNRVRQAVGKD